MNKAFVFDFDDTLASTDAVTLVREKIGGHVVGRLSPQEINAHELHERHYYDYREFQDDAFIQKANPLWLVALVREVYGEGHPVYILTAREYVVADSISVWLQKHGIGATEIHCVGGQDDTVAVCKQRVLLDLLKDYDKVYFYDDSEENVDIFRHEKLRSYLV